MFQQPNLPPGLSLLLALKKAQKRDPNTTSNKLKTMKEVLVSVSESTQRVKILHFM